jgi:DNA-binding MarR family transcriptional regulator
MSRTADPSTRFDPAELTECACANLRKASRVVTQVYDAALQPTGLKATQFTLLANLATLGDLPLTRLADAMVMDRTTLTRNLKPLVAKGLIDIARDDDQRVRRIGLTPPGRAAFDEALPHWRNAQSRFVEGLGSEGWRNLLDGVGATVSVARDD